MPKMKKNMSYNTSQKKGVTHMDKGYSKDDKKMMSGSDYYEPFAGYYNAVNDQATYWNMVNTPKGVIPTDFMEKPLPMANDVGRKSGKKKY